MPTPAGTTKEIQTLITGIMIIIELFMPAICPSVVAAVDYLVIRLMISEVTPDRSGITIRAR